MLSLEQIGLISRKSPTKIILMVIDGLGGLPHPETGKTELETAEKPNLNRIARESICGLVDPICTGITPGSVPGHLAIFGYDPLEFNVGRGVVEALGIDLELQAEDIVARGNFCTVDEQGVITDRRAGRISTEQNVQLCEALAGFTIEGVEIQAIPVKEHRFVLLLRGPDLSADLTDSDPQQVGLVPRRVEPISARAEKTARVVNEFLLQAKKRLRGKTAANMVLLRGFSQLPSLPPFTQIYKLTPAAIAAYPMYRGLAKLVGMKVLSRSDKVREQVDVLRQHYGDYDFFFLHFKNADSRGEDGDFEGKVRAIEELDRVLPEILSLEPEVLIVTGDHSTPATLRSHSWHSVPFMLRSKWCRCDDVREFSEKACLGGGLGRFPAREIMLLAMANALKFDKFGA
jgi:2,3-bisphosphoglycerate-independent phosphoglycerate mutase